MTSLRPLLVVATLTAPTAIADQVLVLGKSPSPLWHQTRSSSAFTASGMTEIALNSLGFASGRISSHSAGQNPIQADLFTHSETYALVLLDVSDLSAVDAALGGTHTFHQLHPSQGADANVPVAVAHEFQEMYASGLRCAGSTMFCTSMQAQTPTVGAEQVQQVLKGNSFLSASDDEDVKFATELAQLLQLSADVKLHSESKQLYVVGISGRHGGKQQAAEQTVLTTVTEFLAQLMKNEQIIGAQIMTGTLPTSEEHVAMLERNRRLASRLNKKKKTIELEAEAGSVWEDNNSTIKTNSTASDKVSMPDIAEFQIILWTSVLLGVVLLLAILAMANMDAGRDSLLYAKFIADVNGRKTN